jgi:hypothetical protein
MDGTTRSPLTSCSAPCPFDFVCRFEPSSTALPDFGPLHYESMVGDNGCIGTTLPFAASCSVQCMSGYVSNGADPSFDCFQTLSHAQLECTQAVEAEAMTSATATQTVWCKAGGARACALAFLPFRFLCCLHSVVQKTFTSAELDSCVWPLAALEPELNGIVRVALSSR